MHPIAKAMLIPFVRICQGVMAIVLVCLALGCVYGIVILERHFFHWDWRVFTVANVAIIYTCIVCYYLEKRAEWWP